MNTPMSRKEYNRKLDKIYADWNIRVPFIMDDNMSNIMNQFNDVRTLNDTISTSGILFPEWVSNNDSDDIEKLLDKIEQIAYGWDDPFIEKIYRLMSSYYWKLMCQCGKIDTSIFVA